MTRLILNIKTDSNSGFSASDVQNGTFYLNGIKHSGGFNIKTGEALATGNASNNWMINAQSVDEEDIRTYSMILWPQTLNEALEFKAVIDGQTFVNRTSIKPEMKEGTSYTYTITVKKTGLVVSSCTIDDWQQGNGNGENVDATMPTE